MLFWNRKKEEAKSFYPKKEEAKAFYPKKEIEVDTTVKPDDWLVVEWGQSPVHCLWYCVLHNMVTKETVGCEEYDTAQEALAEAVRQTKKETK